jgi:hypothetical protein
LTQVVVAGHEAVVNLVAILHGNEAAFHRHVACHKIVAFGLAAASSQVVSAL